MDNPGRPNIITFPKREGPFSGFENGDKGPQAKEYVLPFEAGKGRETDSLKGMLMPWFWPSETSIGLLPNYKLINLYCFRTLS